MTDSLGLAHRHDHHGQRAQATGSATLATGTIIVSQLTSDGTPEWTWEDAGNHTDPYFDVDASGNMYIGVSTGGLVPVTTVYALDTAGQLRWSWSSGGTTSSVRGISVTDVVAVTGQRGDGLSIKP